MEMVVSEAFHRCVEERFLCASSSNRREAREVALVVQQLSSAECLQAAEMLGAYLSSAASPPLLVGIARMLYALINRTLAADKNDKIVCDALVQQHVKTLEMLLPLLLPARHKLLRSLQVRVI